MHGWIYGIQDGLLRDLETTVTAFEEAKTTYLTAVSALG